MLPFDLILVVCSSLFFQSSADTCGYNQSKNSRINLEPSVVSNV
jgi:hypothetical protein